MMEMDYLAQIAGAVRATVIHSPTVYSWFGRRSPALLPRIEKEISRTTARAYLHHHLQSRLYTGFYCLGAAAPRPAEREDVRAGGPADFVQVLSEANSGEGCWQRGWEVVVVEGQTGEGEVAARRGDLLVFASPGQYRVPGDGPGKLRVELHLRKELPAISPGFYMALGNRDLSSGKEGLVRFYWHLTSGGALLLMRLGTRALNEVGIPFRLKVLDDPSRYGRCDSGVLYVREEDYGAAAQAIRQIYPRLRAEVRGGVPALTRQLAPGLGLAEDPGEGDSFGLHRCSVLAEGLIRAFERGQRALEERLQTVAACFAESGIDLARPYVNAGSLDAYELEWAAGAQVVSRPEPGRPATAETGACLRAAESIARRLANEAIWYGGLCNWVGAETVLETDGGASAIEHRALGPDLYTGTAGVGLFLAELHALTGREAYRRTSLGAIRLALRRASDIPPADRAGLYTGQPGIALAAARAGLLLGQDDLIEGARRLARECVSASAKPTERRYDLLSGSAGAIVGRLALAEMLGEGLLVDHALYLGYELLRAARRHPRYNGWSWRSAADHTRKGLLGFSHGAAGIGYALLELAEATGEAAFKEASEGAFRYERRWFDPSAGNWPDFREPSAPGKGAFSYATFWCHGAPGIALSRLRAYALLGGASYLEEASVALRTTACAVEQSLASDSTNFSLCHGLAGNATVLLHGVDSLGEQGGAREWAELVASAAARAISEYADQGVDRSCGTDDSSLGEAPGLMLGLAGTGHFLLRLYHPSTPSILLVKPEEWSRRP